MWSGIFLPTHQGNLRPVVEVEGSSETLMCVCVCVCVCVRACTSLQSFTSQKQLSSCRVIYI